MEELTETEKLLVNHWLLLLQRHKRLYNIDCSHQCLSGHSNKALRIKSSVIQVFEGFDNFFGCLECGQFHICRLDVNTCQVTSDHQEQLLYCLHSGRLLRSPIELVVNPFTLQKDNTGISSSSISSSLPEDGIWDTTKGKRITGSNNKAYTNSRDPTSFKSRGDGQKKDRNDEPKKEEKKKKKKRPREKEEPEMLHDQEFLTGAIPTKKETNFSKKQKKEEKGVDDSSNERQRCKKVYEEEAIEIEEEILKRWKEEEEDGGDNGEIFLGEDVSDRGRNNHISHKSFDNYLYWSTYYSFLCDDLPSEHRIKSDLSQEGEITTIIHDSPLLLTTTTVSPPLLQISQNRSHFSYSLITPLVHEELRCETTLVLERLLSLDGVVQRSHERGALTDILVEFFLPILKNIYLLVHNSPKIKTFQVERQLNRNKRGKYHLQRQQQQQQSLQVLPAKLIVTAFLLKLILEDYHLIDSNDNYIELWVRNPWTLLIHERDLVSQYYTKFHPSNEKITRDKVLKAAQDVKKCLDSYMAHCHWLKEFVHYNSLYYMEVDDGC